MVTLHCAAVGVAGSTFPVDIDETLSVGHLKDAIKEKNSNTVTCDAKDLQLFLAKKANGAWLDGAGVAAVTVDKASGAPVMLDELKNRHDFVKMNPLLWIKNDQHFGENFRPVIRSSQNSRRFTKLVIGLNFRRCCR
ncbi:hypothetical protein C6341_g12540 [Phytophthora cactorum]|nr:hypothetical protein C6341_g12540 [Phytophthora cactorum]